MRHPNKPSKTTQFWNSDVHAQQMSEAEAEIEAMNKRNLRNFLHCCYWALMIGLHHVLFFGGNPDNGMYWYKSPINGMLCHIWDYGYSSDTAFTLWLIALIISIHANIKFRKKIQHYCFHIK